MNPKAALAKFDSFQQTKRWLAVPVAVIKKFGDDQAGNLAALIAYFAFFSLFPLLLVFVTILGFVLHGDHSAQQSVSNSVLGQFPVIGGQIKGQHLSGSAVALVIGIITSLLAGMGITNAAGSAFDRIWAVPYKERPNWINARVHGLTLLVALGVLFVITSGATGLLAGSVGPVAKIGGVILALALNVALFTAAFKLLGTADVPLRALAPGVAVAAVLWEIIQVLGTVYIDHIKSSSNAYGTFALVLGVLAWLHLGAQMTIFCAEINVVLHRRLWPRTLIGPPETRADERTLTALAKVEERSDVEQVHVSFEDPPTAPAPEAVRPAELGSVPPPADVRSVPPPAAA